MSETSSETQKKRSYCCISHEFFRAASTNPNKIAVIHASGEAPIPAPPPPPSPPVYPGDRCFTFSDLLDSINSLSSRLHSILPSGNDGIHSKKFRDLDSTNAFYRPKIVGIYMPPSVEYIIAVLSVLRCGEAFLPLDPSWPKDRILSVVSSSNADLIIASFAGNGCSDKSHWLVEGSICPVLCYSMDEFIEEGVIPSNLVWPCQSERKRLFCYLMYTSGSTGKPKGVCGTEQGLLNRFIWMQELYPLHGEELLLFKTSISFIDHLQEFLAAMLTACTLVIPPFEELQANIFSVVIFLQAYFINRLTAVPSLMRTIFPALQSHMLIPNSLKLLVLSGEVLPLSLWDALSKLLPKTSILNLYGSTEVSGDCTYFDCKRLPMILEMVTLTSVPIGVPIANCDVMLYGENDASNQGEILVGGICIFSGYFSDSTSMSSDYVKLHQNSFCSCSIKENGCQLYFRTGDFAERLHSGDLVFLGRRDRTIKVNGQRIALEEIEDTLRGHPAIVDAAVVSRKGRGELTLFEAFIVLKEKEKCSEIFRSIRSWMVGKLPLAMIPNCFNSIRSIPISSSGKVDYEALAGLAFSSVNVQDEIADFGSGNLLQVIKKAFCDALMLEEVSDDDNFFMIGGNSIAAAQVSHSLGIDMRLLYNFSSPFKLKVAVLEKKGSCNLEDRMDANWEMNMEVGKGYMLDSVNSEAPDLLTLKSRGRSLKTLYKNKENHTVISKRLKVDSNVFVISQSVGPGDGYPWKSALIPLSCSFSRCNKVMLEREYRVNHIPQVTWSAEVPRNKNGAMQELWKVHMESCVDASPIVVFKGLDIYLFIGSHSNKFVCVNAKSGLVQWENKLEGRIESSAVVVGDFSQVVVGCYRGKIYFLDFSSGNTVWTFQTCGEVKAQPVVDKCRQLIWCGSHDHNLYALDYRSHCCIYMLPCGGSIYGSPAIDEVRSILYVASTSGRVTAISLKYLPLNTLWLLELEVPVFGSLSICSTGSVICCLVDGHVIALDTTGSITWRCRTGGPIFAGACISYSLPSQVLVCSRNGSVYSFELEKGILLWEYNVGDPITASAYVDDNLHLVSDASLLSERLVCICTSSGKIVLLRISLKVTERGKEPGAVTVKEFAKLDMEGDIFSSPVMIGGRIFVGCRDDYVHCIAVET